MRLLMSESRLDARIVRLDYHTGNTGLIYATSPDLKGLVVSRSSLEALEEAIPQAIVEMYAACGERVEVRRVRKEDVDGNHAWVAMPTDVARGSADRPSSAHA
jgi:hypothetical protein